MTHKDYCPTCGTFGTCTPRPIGENDPAEMDTNTELLDALEHAVNWGHGFEGTGTRPEWLTEAEEAIRKAKEKP